MSVWCTRVTELLPPRSPAPKAFCLDLSPLPSTPFLLFFPLLLATLLSFLFGLIFTQILRFVRSCLLFRIHFLCSCLIWPFLFRLCLLCQICFLDLCLFWPFLFCPFLSALSVSPLSSCVCYVCFCFVRLVLLCLFLFCLFVYALSVFVLSIHVCSVLFCNVRLYLLCLFLFCPFMSALCSLDFSFLVLSVHLWFVPICFVGLCLLCPSWFFFFCSCLLSPYLLCLFMSALYVRLFEFISALTVFRYVMLS